MPELESEETKPITDGQRWLELVAGGGVIRRDVAPSAGVARARRLPPLRLLVERVASSR